MKHIITGFILLFLLSFPELSFSQGFLGYRQTLTGGINFSPSGLRYDPYIGQNDSYQENGSYSRWHAHYDKNYFLPAFSLSYGINLGSHVQFNASLGWRPLRNSALVFYSERLMKDGAYASLVDSFLVRSNATELNGEFRFYGEFAPVGRYFTLGGGMSVTGSTITPVYESSYNNVNIREVKPQAFVRKTFFQLSIGFGRTRILNRKHLIDYGAKLNYYVGSLVFEDLINLSVNNPSDNYLNDAGFESYLRLANITNLQYYNTLEIYLKYGIAW